jgi:hypothetical protein
MEDLTMDNNQYLLGIMTDRCRILEAALNKSNLENKQMAIELKAFRDEEKVVNPKDKKVVALKPKNKGGKK